MILNLSLNSKQQTNPEVIKIKLKDRSYSMTGQFIRDDGKELEYEEATFFIKEDIEELFAELESWSQADADYNYWISSLKKQHLGD